MKEFLSSRKFMLVASFLGLYLLSTGASLAVFSYLRGEPALELTTGELADKRSRIAELPKTESCPINGGMFTKVEQSIWEPRRPIVAIIENHVDSRPPSGLSRADVVYEAVAEGGITRFLAVFYCGAAAEDLQIAPVRSARVYFVDWAAAYGDKPIFMHVGGANDYSGSGDTARNARALELLETMGWRVPRGNDFDTTYDSGFPVFWRNYERLDRPVATEHTMMASLDAAYEEASKRKLNAKDSEGVRWDSEFDPWEFIDDNPLSSPKAEKISFGFWDNKSNYDVVWEYDKDNNQYLRSNGGKPHKDLNNDTQLSAKNVAILFTKELTGVDRNKHVLYTTVGRGNAIVFQNGDAIEGTWEKETQEDMIIFRDKKGKETGFVKGTTWVEVLSTGNEVNY